jgi:hypothetical protein
MSEDRFFQQVNSVMANYSPEVPEGVYSGMRKKLWWSNFTRFSLTRLNMWYMLLAIASITAWIAMSPDAAVVQQPQLPSEQVAVSSSDGSNYEVGQTLQSSQNQPKQSMPAQVQSKDFSTQNNHNATVQSQDPTSQLENQDNAVNIAEPAQHEASELPIANEQVQAADAIKKGSKKGLKVKSYEQAEKK